MLKIKEYKGITLIALVISIIVLLILAGVTINAISGSDSAPAKANEAGQKNDIGAAKDDISLTATNTKLQGMEAAYVSNGVSAGDASTTVGQTVIDSILAKNGTSFGKASIEVKQAEENGIKGNASVSIYTTDFVVDGTITIEDGILTWGEIEPNIPRIVGVPDKLSLTTVSFPFTINATVKGTESSISWNSNVPTIVSVSNGILTVDTKKIIDTTTVIITASAEGCEDKICTVTIKEVPVEASLDKNYVGYYAYVDGVYGIIYADLLYQAGTDGKWNNKDDSEWNIEPIEEGTTFKTYEVKTLGESDRKFGDYTDTGVLTLKNGTTGSDRFYVMGLDNIDNNDNMNWSTALTKEHDNWKLPTKEQWAMFGSSLNKITTSNYRNYNLYDFYWSSTESVSNTVWAARFGAGCCIQQGKSGSDAVRLCTTF